MLIPVRTSAPATTPVSLDEAKEFLRVDHDDHDALITTLLAAATERLDGRGQLGRCMVTQTWRLDMTAWPAGDLRLGFPDVQSVVVKYFDEVDVEQTLAADSYQVLADARGGFIRYRDAFASPSLYSDRSDAVQVTMVAGYGAAAAVPAPLKSALLVSVLHWYDLGKPRELPEAIAPLITQYRFNRL